MTGLSRTTIWRLERRGDFPRHRRISRNAVAWAEHEVGEWIRAKLGPDPQPASDRLTKPSAAAKAVLNLREATEDGALIAESKAAAEAAGLTFIHVPFRGSAPDEAVADQFLKIVTSTANQPLFINCGSANRVGALWLVKRIVVDRWAEDRAVEEAKAIGLSSAALEKWALAFAAKRK